MTVGRPGILLDRDGTVIVVLYGLDDVTRVHEHIAAPFILERLAAHTLEQVPA